MSLYLGCVAVILVSASISFQRTSIVEFLVFFSPVFQKRNSILSNFVAKIFLLNKIIFFIEKYC